MRSYIRNLIKNDSVIQGLGVTLVSSGDIDTPPESQRPFINLKWGTTSPTFRESLVRRHVLSIWVHDQPNDYTRIQGILARLQVLLKGVQGQAWTEGEDNTQTGYITLIEYDGDSPDLSDPGHGTIVKQGNYTIVGY